MKPTSDLAKLFYDAANEKAEPKSYPWEELGEGVQAVIIVGAETLTTALDDEWRTRLATILDDPNSAEVGHLKDAIRELIAIERN